MEDDDPQEILLATPVEWIYEQLKEDSEYREPLVSGEYEPFLARLEYIPQLSTHVLILHCRENK